MVVKTLNMTNAPDVRIFRVVNLVSNIVPTGLVSSWRLCGSTSIMRRKQPNEMRHDTHMNISPPARSPASWRLCGSTSIMRRKQPHEMRHDTHINISPPARSPEMLQA
ncbi:hypothetical protein J6590_013193 [Homalodisca vitripennis]|nr:hypothetical protein J6590_013193 [Homalodisca vitripennis]